jgi:predicted Fe-S protein YdhL (DUF1289 family)
MSDWDTLRKDMAEGHLSKKERALISKLETNYNNMKAELDAMNKLKLESGSTLSFGEWITSLFKKKNVICSKCQSKPGTICQGCFNKLNEQLMNLSVENAELMKIIQDKSNEKELENYWNNKRPKSNVTFPARPCHKDKSTEKWYVKNIAVDPRVYFTHDTTLPTFKGTNDQKASKCLDWVKNNVRYTSDDSEFWQFAFETLRRKKGDCEDGAILMANMMLMSGVPYWRVRLNAGSVRGGGHAYVTYLREKDNQWYVMDWCYWYNASKNFGRTFHDAENYFGIWFSWNTEYLYKDAKFGR